MIKLDRQLKTLPDTPGVYLFYNTKKEIIYVGKASSLKSRVASYFRGARSPRPIETMIHQVADLKTIKTDSALEAAILEGALIKKYRPKYNVDWKDDKSWNYIIITKDKFPQVKTMRERELFTPNTSHLTPHTSVFGPYPGLNTKVAMKILRKIFKFSDCSEKSNKPCFYRQIGECLGVCTGEITPVEYKRIVISPLITFLSGNKQRLLKQLNTKMVQASKERNFEEAGRLRDQVKALQRIQDVALLNESFMKEKISAKGRPAFGWKNKIVRIEGYDISNLGATDKVGSMVVFDEDGPVKSEYRKFNIKTVVGQSDVDCLKEVLTRRLRHSEWPMPDVFLIDGGLPQVNAVKSVLDSHFHGNDSRLIVGIAKGPERKRNDFIVANSQKHPEMVEWMKNHKSLLIQVRDEAHRFAITFNRSKRKLSYK